MVKPKPLQEVSQTTDTKAATTDKESKRYAASECEMTQQDHEEEPLRLQQPFYLKQSQPMSADEDVEAF